MSSVQANRLKKGMLIKMGDDLLRIFDLHHLTQGNKRAHMQARMRDIRNGRKIVSSAPSLMNAKCSSSTRTATCITS
jgi:translation elongation factor P/translation initiation factor 5A